ncbi:hypothetical protein OEA41_003025 [Lepraria neglecta]|uniref:Uncharacterized protein n=1 Tax=Lepraria neglecta TaxID=209136 RepID=A0AAD9Z3W5_9LECA|nr:hypothetical protein OEA41_003025 [Lepraria neglecta]
MSTLSPSSAAAPNTTHPQRAPPPSLFLGPPSRNASNVSLSQPGPSTQPPSSQTRAPLLRSRSTRGPDTTVTSAPLGRSRPQAPQQTQTEGDRTDALWAEMQATLAEVELSAFSSTHVFGSAHIAALEELREAQIALAQAWGRGEAGEDEELEEDKAHVGKAKEEAKKDWGAEGGEEEEGDIVEARRRREANEKFFRRVGEGVVDVVGKLEGVAEAMAKVERESREIWSEKDSVESESVAA